MNKTSTIFFIILIGYSLYCLITVITGKSKNKYKNKIIDKNYLLSLSPREFEIFCANLFVKLGYNVELTQYKYDGGKDIIITNNAGEKTFIECKRWSEGSTKAGYVIGREICQKLVGAMVQNGVKHGIIISTVDTYKTAIEYKKELEKNSDLTLEFINTYELLKLVKEVENINNKKTAEC